MQPPACTGKCAATRRVWRGAMRGQSRDALLDDALLDKAEHEALAELQLCLSTSRFGSVSIGESKRTVRTHNN